MIQLAVQRLCLDADEAVCWHEHRALRNDHRAARSTPQHRPSMPIRRFQTGVDQAPTRALPQRDPLPEMAGAADTHARAPRRNTPDRSPPHGAGPLPDSQKRADRISASSGDVPGHTIRKYQQFPACAGGQSDRSPGEPSQSTDHPGTGRSPCGLPARSTRGPPLYDFATPLLRHETGDEAECAGACPCGWNSLSARASSGERSTSCSRSAAGKPWPMRSGPPQQPHGNQKALRNQKALHRRIARVSCGLHSR